MPLAEVLTQHWRTVLLAGGTFIATNGIAYVYMVYVLKYGESVLGFDRSTMLFLLIASCPFWMAGMAISAARSDILGRRKVYIRPPSPSWCARRRSSRSSTQATSP